MDTSVSKQTLALRAAVQAHPYLFCLALVATVPITALLGRIGLQYLAPAMPADLSPLGAALRTLLVVEIIAMLGWWRGCGFTRPREWRDLHLYLLLLVPLIFPLLAATNPHITNPFILLALAGVVLLVAFNEEAMCRGLMLRAILPRGPVRAAVFSGVFFGLAHLPGAFMGRDPVYVVGQVFFAGGLGIMFGALRIRTNTSWPLVAAHAANDWLVFTALGPDLMTHTPGLAAFIDTGILVAVMVALALFLLRPSRTAGILRD